MDNTTKTQFDYQSIIEACGIQVSQYFGYVKVKIRIFSFCFKIKKYLIQNITKTFLQYNCSNFLNKGTYLNVNKVII